jgi:hypothetical protein
MHSSTNSPENTMTPDQRLKYLQQLWSEWSAELRPRMRELIVPDKESFAKTYQMNVPAYQAVLSPKTIAFQVKPCGYKSPITGEIWKGSEVHSEGFFIGYHDWQRTR